jgi:hypothetical protein
MLIIFLELSSLEIDLSIISLPLVAKKISREIEEETLIYLENK